MVQAFVVREGLLCIGDSGPFVLDWRSASSKRVDPEALERYMALPFVARQRALPEAAKAYAVLKYGSYRGAPDSGPEVVAELATTPELLDFLRKAWANDSCGNDEWSYDFAPAVWDGSRYEEPPA